MCILKNYRILKLSNFKYQKAVSEYYSQHVKIKNASYENQENYLINDAFFYSDAFSQLMRQQGQDVTEVYTDLELLQKTWAKENNVRINIKNWRTQITLAQIRIIKPDVILFQNQMILPHRIRKQLKSMFPFIRLMILQTDCDTQIKMLGDFDIILAQSPRISAIFSKAGFIADLVYHGFDQQIPKRLHNIQLDHNIKQYDVGFHGLTGYGCVANYKKRYWSLMHLLKEDLVHVWGDEKLNEPEISLRQDRYSQLDKILPDALISYYINAFWTKPLFNQEHHEFISVIKNISLNSKIAILGCGEPSIRLYRFLQKVRSDVTVICFIDEMMEGEIDNVPLLRPELLSEQSFDIILTLFDENETLVSSISQFNNQTKCVQHRYLRQRLDQFEWMHDHIDNTTINLNTSNFTSKNAFQEIEQVIENNVMLYLDYLCTLLLKKIIINERLHDTVNPLVPLCDMFPENCHQPIFGLPMYDLIRHTKLVFNAHFSQLVSEVGNLRMFQVTGMGSCLITDTGKNIHELFEPDEEVVTYESIEEAAEKIKYLLDNEKERHNIALAGQKRTLKSHTLAQRIQQIDAIIQDNL